MLTTTTAVRVQGDAHNERNLDFIFCQSSIRERGEKNVVKASVPGSRKKIKFIVGITFFLPKTQ